MADAERCQRVEQRVDQRRRRAGRAGLAAALDVERVRGWRAYRGEVEERQLVGARQLVVVERAGKQRPALVVVDDALEAGLAETLHDAAMKLAGEQQRV